MWSYVQMWFQEPVRQAYALDHDMVGELEATLEGPLGDALVERTSTSCARSRRP
jgi:hypothetical protein